MTDWTFEHRYKLVKTVVIYRFLEDGTIEILRQVPIHSEEEFFASYDTDFVPLRAQYAFVGVFGVSKDGGIIL